ncbi:MAG TPA: family 16 glycosylhydrolase [Pirellulales bacterium]|jgi:autotransporter-associated beta strand protein|nr:family 16 glycosylhydrolase [Pirellulales bacterium]
MVFRRAILPLATVLLAAIGCASIVAQAWADPPSGTNERLVFADNFNGTTLDTSKWLNSSSSDNWAMPASAATANSSQVKVANGMATITAQRTSSTAFTSGDITTYQKYNFSGGYFEARIQLPSTVGSWPAFWGLYTGWPPEADIMEYPDTTNGGTTGLSSSQYNTNYHYTNSSGGDSAGAGAVNPGAGNLEGTWHTFGMQWNAGASVAFYFDGHQVSSYTGSTVAQMANMYMLLDYAVGGWPGTPSTTQWAIGHTDQMNIDWVRVWQTNPNSDAPTSWNVSGNGNFGTSGNWTGGVPNYGNEVATFGRVGTASSAFITMNNSWQLFGGITFDGLTTGTNAGTTAYTVGSAGSTNQIQLASTGNAVVQATAASTANQTINAPLDLNNNVFFSNFMTGAQTLSLGGTIAGPGSLIVGTTNGTNAPGTVIVSGNNSYTGGTVVGSNQEGAILEATSNTALSTGTVIIGTAGNGTTARLEVAGSHTLANNIDFRGRNTNSVGIESLSGNNVFSGTISAGAGGSTYQIQVDSGSNLTLSGAAAGATTAGVALEASSTTSTRTFTLQGAGTGSINGAIANGNATVTVAIAKSDAGTWILNHSNSYTGPTTVNLGTLSLGVANAISSSSQIVLNGGILATGSRNQSFTTLVLGGNSILDLGNTLQANNVTFADSHTTAWSGALTVRNWNFGADHLSFGAGGLSSTQLGDIQFSDFPVGASLITATTAGAARAIGEVTPLVGDVNGDGHVDVSDVMALAQALTDVATYQQNRMSGSGGITASPTGTFTASDVQFALDINGDGADNNMDLQSLLNYLIAGNGSTAAVPEPSSVALLTLGALGFIWTKRRR